MIAESVEERRRMGKTQKTIMVHEDVAALVEYLENRHGATFSRQAAAALLAYLVADPSGPNQFWMEEMVLIEKGKSTVADAMRNWAQCELDHANGLVEMWTAWAEQNGADKESTLKPWIQRQDQAKLKLRRIKNILKADADPIKAVISYWDKQNRGD